MNRILYVGRMAKGLSEEQMAKVLQIAVSDYKALEHSLTDVTAQQALKLSKVFGIDPEVFIYTEGRESRLLKYAVDEILAFSRTACWMIYLQINSLASPALPIPRFRYLYSSATPFTNNTNWKKITML